MSVSMKIYLIETSQRHVMPAEKKCKFKITDSKTTTLSKIFRIT